MAEPTPDLAVIVANLKRVTDGGSWVAIDRQSTELVVAALERQAELEGALQELVDESPWPDETPNPAFERAVLQAEALLARSAAEVGERG